MVKTKQHTKRAFSDRNASVINLATIIPQKLKQVRKPDAIAYFVYIQPKRLYRLFLLQIEVPVTSGLVE